MMIPWLAGLTLIKDSVFGFFMNPKVLMALAVLALVAFIWFRDRANIAKIEAQGATIARMEEQAKQAAQRIEMLETTARAQAKVDQVLADRIAEQEKAKAKINKLKDGVKNVKPEDNGAIAPVLRDALNGLSNN